MITKKAAEILLEVRKLILKHPQRFNISHWFGSESLSECGTSACIAGWICMVDLKTEQPSEAVKIMRFDMTQAEDKAQDILQCYNTHDLFFHQNWDESFSKAYSDEQNLFFSSNLKGNAIEHKRRCAEISADWIVFWMNREGIEDGVELPSFVWFKTGV